MLVLLVLCAYLQTLKGAPLLSPDASSFVAAVDLMGRDSPIDPACGGSQCRSRYSIVQSCFLTIFTCVWTSLHPNINGPRDSNWTCFKRKVVMMLCVVIAPEAVLYWALRQQLAAKRIAKMYNEIFAEPGETVRGGTSLWRKVMDQFRPLSEETTWREDGQSWTTTHGFFIQMGGFILYKNGRPTQVLDYHRLIQLLRDKAMDTPTITERDLQDRSKGDAISKAIVVLQTTWFVFQCFAQWRQHLPLSELEVLTLAFAVMNVAIYAAWWNKPQGVGMAICVPLRRRENQIDTPSTGMTPLVGEAQLAPENLSLTELAGHPQAEDQHSLMPDNSSLIFPHNQERDESGVEKHSWLRRMLRKDREQDSSPVFSLFRLPYWIVVSLLRPLKKILTFDNISKNALRVPMFYASERHRSGDAILVASGGVGTIFGAIHLLAWASQFPTPRDIVLWRVSAIVLTVTPLLLALLGAMFMTCLHRHIGVIALYIARCVTYSTYLLLPFYIVGRFVVIIIALLALHDPPRAVLRDISWTSYIPHF